MSRGPLRRLAWGLVLVAMAGPTSAQTRTVFPSADGPRSDPVMVRGLLFRAPAVVGAGRAAVVILPDCQGAWEDEGATRPRQALQELAQALNDAGLHALVVDSLRPRGVREICSQKIASRAVKLRHLRRDALASLDFLGRQAGVDAERLGLLGIGRGADAALSAANLAHGDVQRAPRAARAVVALSPACPADPGPSFTTTSTLRLMASGPGRTACQSWATTLEKAGPSTSWAEGPDLAAVALLRDLLSEDSSHVAHGDEPRLTRRP